MLRFSGLLGVSHSISFYLLGGLFSSLSVSVSLPVGLSLSLSLCRSFSLSLFTVSLSVGLSLYLSSFRALILPVGLCLSFCWSLSLSLRSLSISVGQSVFLTGSLCSFLPTISLHVLTYVVSIVFSPSPTLSVSFVYLRYSYTLLSCFSVSSRLSLLPSFLIYIPPSFLSLSSSLSPFLILTFSLYL